MHLFPTPEDFANATQEEVYQSWKGLGYYNRALNLQNTVKTVLHEYQGVFPNDYTLAQKLPGIGTYSAASILAIVYGNPIPAIDGNVMRICSRLRCLDALMQSTELRKQSFALIKEWMPESAISDFTQALMELGAILCSPENPNCLFCPIQSHCEAYSQKKTPDYPKKKTKKPVKKSKRLVAICVNDNQILIQQRPKTGMLANLWEYPNIESEDITELDRFVTDTLSLPFSDRSKLGEAVFTFTHRRWDMTAYLYSCSTRNELVNCQWTAIAELGNKTLPRAFAELTHLIMKQFNTGFEYEIKFL